MKWSKFSIRIKLLLHTYPRIRYLYEKLATNEQNPLELMQSIPLVPHTHILPSQIIHCAFKQAYVYGFSCTKIKLDNLIEKMSSFGRSIALNIEDMYEEMRKTIMCHIPPSCKQTLYVISPIFFQ